ncbi:MAG: Methionine--tRNA ligase [bacterium ADurb.Bin400]|nr:MAG: Methionine--tRNA ligase [bacterium ADurb.Bin400]
MNKIYITTPIYYVNDVPHIGHAYTTVAADVLARYYKKRLGEENVFFLTGTDEHGAKIAEAATKAGKEPKQFVDDLVPRFQEAWKNLNIEYSEFFRTTIPQHEKLVQDFVLRLKDKGYIEKRRYEGLYCVGCERFLKESELIDGMCPDHKRKPVLQTEENYFFLLSKLANQLLEKIESGELQIGPETRKNEVVAKIKLGLEDVSISRAAVEWGVRFPGDESQTIYVWIDALLNYWTATKIYNKESFWPADLHLMAKDILWFHAVIWPAMLIAGGEELPRKVFAHGFFTINGQKMSKSLGNVIDPNEVADRFGADAVRYALLREFPFGEDGDISVEKIAVRYSELANGLGNLLQRTLSMINRFQVQVEKKNLSPNDYISLAKKPVSFKELGLEGKVGSHLEVLEAFLPELMFDGALVLLMKIASECDDYLSKKEPWKMAKTNLDAAGQVLNDVYNVLLLVADIAEPFMPETSEKMKKQLETLQPEPLFPRLD